MIYGRICNISVTAVQEEATIHWMSDVSVVCV